MTPEQCRGARGLIGWTQKQLADAAGVSVNTVLDFEAVRRVPIARNLQAMQEALERAGVEFTNGEEPGVKLRRK